jgi:hypothetical protein
MLRWGRLLYFGGHTSCYAGHIYCTSVALHVTLGTSSVAEKLNVQYQWVSHSKGQFTKTACPVQRGSPKCLPILEQ